MVEVLSPHLERQGHRGGQNKLPVEDKLLIALEYWREYRSQFHIGVSWGVHETTLLTAHQQSRSTVASRVGSFASPASDSYTNPVGSGK